MKKGGLSIILTALAGGALALTLSPYNDEYMRLASFASKMLLYLDAESAHEWGIYAAKNGLSPAGANFCYS